MMHNEASQPPRAAADAAGPVYLGIELTRRCSQRCPHCFTSSGPTLGPGPPTELVVQLLEDAAAAGIRKVGFSGGEPLLRNDLGEIMRRGREKGIESYGIVTNGFGADPAPARDLRSAGTDVIQVSIDGPDVASHTAVRACRPADYYAALRAVRVYRDAGIHVDVATILHPRNLRRVAGMVLLCEALGARHLRYCSFVPTGRARAATVREDYRTEPAELDRFLAFVRELNAQPDAPLRITFDHGIGPWNEDGAFACDSGRAVAYVSAEGDLYPCPGLLFQAFKVGNVFAEPIAELLVAPGMAVARNVSRDDIGEPCSSCGNAACTGGCRGGAFAATGDLRAAPEYCNVRRRRPQ